MQPDSSEQQVCQRTKLWATLPVNLTCSYKKVQHQLALWVLLCTHAAHIVYIRGGVISIFVKQNTKSHLSAGIYDLRSTSTTLLLPSLLCYLFSYISSLRSHKKRRILRLACCLLLDNSNNVFSSHAGAVEYSTRGVNTHIPRY